MSTNVEEQTESTTGTSNVYGHKVILFNDSYNTFDHVEECLVKICGKTTDEAIKIALEAHTRGKAVCYTGSEEACETVIGKMSDENLTVSLE